MKLSHAIEPPVAQEDLQMAKRRCAGVTDEFLVSVIGRLPGPDSAGVPPQQIAAN